MSLLANVPTLSYISWKNMIITYNETTYQIENSHTNKAYIYWDLKNPYLLTTSNVKLEPRNDLFYIIFNNSGNYTVVPNDDIEIDFSENPSRNAITNRIVGLSNDTKDKFTAVQVDIDGIKFDVYDAEGKYSKLEQRADKIDLEVKGVQKQYSTDAKLTEMREDFSASLLSLQATLGLFSSDMNTYMEDNKLTTEEKNKINAYKSSLEEKRVELNTQLDTIKTYLQSLENVDTGKITKLDTARNELNTSISNLFTNINTVCSDNAFTNTEITTVVTYFGRVNVEINECKNTIDECIFLGIDGLLIEEISNITLTQNNIKLEVKKVENHVDTEVSRIELEQDNISLEVKKVENHVNSEISRVENHVNTEISKIELGKDNISLEVSRIENKINTEVSNVKNQINSEISKVENHINTEISRIELEQDNISLEVSNVEKHINTEVSNVKNQINSEISKVESYIDTEISKIELEKDSILLEVSDVEKHINSEISRVESHINTEVSKIKLEQDNIKSEVKKFTDDYVTSSEITQASDSIKMAFLQGGGINKFHNSSFKNGTKYWSHLTWNSNGGSGGGSQIYVLAPPDHWCLPNRNVLCAMADNLNNDTGHALGVGFDSEKIWGGTEWTLECLLACHRADNIHIEIIEFDINGNQLYTHQNKIVTAKGGGKDRGNWTKVNYQFTLQHSNCAWFICRFFMGAWTGESSNAHMWIGEPMLVPGHHSELLYSPNADEVYEGITRIDKDGITVSNSNASTTTSMTADGFYINQNGHGDVFKVDGNGISLSQGIVNLNKDGLTIVSPNYNVRTYIDANGLNVVQNGSSAIKVHNNGLEISQGLVNLSQNGLTINSPNYNVQTYIDANGLNVVQNGYPAIMVHSNGLEIAQGLVNINSQHMRISHSDGTYSEMNADGLVHYQNGTGRKYHYLVYAGEYTCYSEETVTVRLPDEFRNKQFYVVTAIKRIYAQNNTDITGAKFPLLSFYAEAVNANYASATFQVYASVRAWNRTGVSGLGTLVGDGSIGSTESNLLKPVVAYWVFA